MLVYVGGSMKNRDGIRGVIKDLEKAGHQVFYDWIMPGEETDVKWKEFEESLGHSFIEALWGPHVGDVFEFDKSWLDAADAFVLVYPAGKSTHIELGYMVGLGKYTAVLLDQEPDRWDIMLRFADLVTYDIEEILDDLFHAPRAGVKEKTDRREQE